MLLIDKKGQIQKRREAAANAIMKQQWLAAETRQAEAKPALFVR